MEKVAELVRKRTLSLKDVEELNRHYSGTDVLEPTGYKLHNTPEELKLLDLLSRSVKAGLLEDKGTLVPMPSVTSGGKPLYSKTRFIIKPGVKPALAEYLKKHSG